MIKNKLKEKKEKKKKEEKEKEEKNKREVLHEKFPTNASLHDKLKRYIDMFFSLENKPKPYNKRFRSVYNHEKVSLVISLSSLAQLTIFLFFN